MLRKIVILLLSIFLLQAKPVLGQKKIFDGIKKIYAFDAKGKGVKSKLFKIDCKGNRIRVGVTDDVGYKQVYLLCEYGDQIEACPKSGNYFYRRVECTKTIMQKIKVTKKSIYKLIYHDGREIEAEIKGMSPRGIQVVAVGRHTTETVLCKDLDKILEPEYAEAAHKIAKGGGRGAAVGAGIGLFFGGIGAIPGAGIGFVIGSVASAFETD